MPKVKIETKDQDNIKEEIKETFFTCALAIAKNCLDNKIAWGECNDKNNEIFENFYKHFTLQCAIMFSKREDAKKIEVRIEKDTLSNKEFRFLIKAIADLHIERALRMRGIECNKKK